MVNWYGKWRSQSPTIKRGIILLDRVSADPTGPVEERIQKGLSPTRLSQSANEINVVADGGGRHLCSLDCSGRKSFPTSKSLS
jgi:hypothetical protein